MHKASQSDLTWARLTSGSENAPPARLATSAAWSSQSAAAVVFGGLRPVPTGDMSDTWQWDGASWSEASSEPSPPARHDHMLSRCDAAGTLLLFGGLAVNEAGASLGVADPWTWDGSRWNVISGIGPSARSAGSMAFDEARQEVVLFGGAPSVSPLAPVSGPPVLGDTWVWSGGVWTQKHPSTSPSPRMGAAMGYDSTLGCILLFGGGAGLLYTDTWAWDGSDWSLIETSESPPGRTRAGVTYHTDAGLSVLFGGVGIVPGSTTSDIGDTWVFDGQDWSELPMISNPPGGDGRALFNAQALGSTLLLRTVVQKTRNISTGIWTPQPLEFSMWFLS